jgi:hypothetical protein
MPWGSSSLASWFFVIGFCALPHSGQGLPSNSTSPLTGLEQASDVVKDLNCGEILGPSARQFGDFPRALGPIATNEISDGKEGAPVVGNATVEALRYLRVGQG